MWKPHSLSPNKIKNTAKRVAKTQMYGEIDHAIMIQT